MKEREGPKTACLGDRRAVFLSPPPTREEWRLRAEQVLARDEEVAFGQVFAVRQGVWSSGQNAGPEGQGRAGEPRCLGGRAGSGIYENSCQVSRERE